MLKCMNVSPTHNLFISEMGPSLKKKYFYLKTHHQYLKYHWAGRGSEEGLEIHFGGLLVRLAMSFWDEQLGRQ